MSNETLTPFRARRSGLALLLLGLPLTVSSEAHADDRALIIGVGRYRNPSINLEGIDLDVDMMKDTAKRMGFSDIQVLMDGEATVAATTRAIRTYLGEAGEKDRVLLYFSGHGTSIPDKSDDEDDGRDEALVLYEASGAGTEGLLVDDELEQILQGLKAAKILMFIDACHSGTVYKSFAPENHRLDPRALGVDGKGKRKFIQYLDDDVGAKRSATLLKGFGVRARAGASRNGSDVRSRLVAYTAAQDNEAAIATEAGSVFTLGLHDLFKEASKANASKSNGRPKVAYQKVIEHVRDYVVARRMDFVPQVFLGDQVKNDGGIEIVSASRQSRPSWDRVSQLVDGGQPLDIMTRGRKSRYKLNENLELQVKVPATGYLNIIAVDAHDAAVVLYPNEYQTDNRVRPGLVLVPGESDDFDLAAVEPTGNVLIAAFLTAKPLNFHKESTGLRISVDTMKEAIGNPVAYRSFRPVARASGYQAGKLELVVTR